MGPPGLVRTTARTLGMLALLQAALPLSLALTACALVAGRGRGPARATSTRPRTVLLSGGKMTKALALARAFHRAGHRVVLVETRRYRWSGHRFSRAVDAFHVVPAAEDPGYADALADVVRREGVDVFVPVSSPAASRHDADAAAVLGPGCEVVAPGSDLVRRLDDKDAFARLCEEVGVPVATTHRVTSAEDVVRIVHGPDAEPGARWVLKSIPYDPVHRLDLTTVPLATPAATAAFVRTLPVSAAQPFVLQRFVAGREYCTHATVRDGAVRLHACCASSAFQLNYAMVDDPDIEAWVRRFVGALGVTGQLSFDLIRDEHGGLHAIECNPRTHSAITMFYDHPDVAAAYLEAGADTVRPTAASRPTYWLYRELWRLLRDPRTVGERWRTVRDGTDAILAASDPLPFLLVHHLQIPRLLVGHLVRGRPWVRVDVNIGKLVAPGGD